MGGRDKEEPLLNLTPRVRALRLLRQWILQERLPRGERLPPEQVLSAELQVSRTTLRAALAQLEEERLIEPTRYGRGRVVSASVFRSKGLLARTIVLIDPSLDEDESYVEEHGCQRQIREYASRVVHGLGLHSMMLNTRSCEELEIRELVEQAPHGVLLLGPMQSRQNLVENFLQHRVPVACYSDAWESKDVSSVHVDHRAGAAEITRWLLDRGHSRILPCWILEPAEEPKWLTERAAGYKATVEGKGVAAMQPVECRVPNIAPTSRDDFEMEARLIAGHLVEYLGSADPIDAIMATSDRAAIAIAAACRIFGKEPNQDIQIVGFGNSWAQCPENEWERQRPVASVEWPVRQIADELIDLVMNPPEQARSRVIPPRVVSAED